MGRKRAGPTIDPTTGKPLPDNVKYRGPGQYQARKLVSGRRAAKTFETAAKAAKWLMHAQTDKDRGVFVDLSLAERTSLKALLERYRTQVSPGKKGGVQEAGHLLVIERDDIALLKIAKLGSDDAVEWRDRMLSAGYAPATIVRRMNLVQHIIKHARSEWKIRLAANPLQDVNRPVGADVDRDRVFKDTAEEDAIFSAVENDALVFHAAKWALGSAMRQGEVCAVSRKTDLKPDVCVVRGISGDGSKNDEIREVPIFSRAQCALANIPYLPDIIAALDELPRAIDSRLFPIDRSVLKVRWRRAMAKAGIEDFHFHDLRHVSTGRIALLYTNVLDLALVTGHKDLNSLKRYYNISGADLKKRAAQPSAGPSSSSDSSGAAPMPAPSVS